MEYKNGSLLAICEETGQQREKAKNVNCCARIPANRGYVSRPHKAHLGISKTVGKNGENVEMGKNEGRHQHFFGLQCHICLKKLGVNLCQGCPMNREKLSA